MSRSKRPLIFGEVLFDCFPDGRQVPGGAPFNVAWHCQAFGLNPLFISRVGNDDLGENITAAMREWGMDIGGLQFDDAHPTGKVAVSITDGEPSYDIVQNSAWDFIARDQLPEPVHAMLLYHGTLILRNKASRSALNWLKSKTDIPVFVDINLRPPWWELSTVREVIQDSHWLKLNEDELALITPDAKNLEESMTTLQSQNPLELLIVTQGEKGAAILSPDLGLLNVMPETNKTVIDTVGAGDAFSSIFLVGQFYGWPLQTTMERAQAFASAIVGVRGATVSDPLFYQSFLEEWQVAP